MKNMLLTAMVLLGGLVSNAQTQNGKTNPVKPVPGQTPPQAPPKQPAPQMINITVTDSIKKADSIKRKKIKSKIPSMGIEKERNR